jgi:hypothetical protein
MAIKQRLSKLEKKIRPMERETVSETLIIGDLPSGLTEAERREFIERRTREYWERRSDRGEKNLVLWVVTPPPT